MTGIIALYHLLIHPLAVPFWAALSALLLHIFNVWREQSKNKIEEKKITITETHGERQQSREDFQVIKDTLYSEINRLKDSQKETTRQLEESNEETKKCEQRYFELATQYRELLKYCATLSRRVRELEGLVKAHVSKENKVRNDETRTNQETTGSQPE